MRKTSIYNGFAHAHNFYYRSHAQDFYIQRFCSCAQLILQFCSCDFFLPTVLLMRTIYITFLLMRKTSQFLNDNICMLNTVTFLLRNLRLSKIVSHTADTTIILFALQLLFSRHTLQLYERVNYKTYDKHLIFVVPCIMLYNGEISPKRCNNRVFYSQWLYSTCFGWQSHPSSGVQCCIWPQVSWLT